MSAYYHSRGRTVPPARILLTASTSEAYAYLFKLLANPGDEVLVPRPSYPLFEFLATMESVQVRQYPLVYDNGWRSIRTRWRRRSRRGPARMMLVNPNNPTGSYVKPANLRALTRLCRDRDVALISDEVFADYALRRAMPRVSRR